MASLKKKSTTRDMPDGAETFTKKGVTHARWKDRNGKMQTGRVNAAGRVVVESSTWYAKFTTAAGHSVERPTGCTDKGAALAKLAALTAEQDRVKAGIATQSELDVSKKMAGAVSAAIADYENHMKALGLSGQHSYNVRLYLDNTAAALGWKSLRNLSGSALSAWLDKQATTPKEQDRPETVMGAVTHNKTINAWAGFAKWLMKHGRLNKNPFAGLSKRDAHADQKRPRRALTPEELTALFKAARNRPLMEAEKLNRGADKGKPGADPTDKTKDALRWKGAVHATAYKTAALTGLRLGELRSITLGAVNLDAETPHLILQARNEKNRQGSQIPVAADFVPELKEYITERRARLTGQHSASIVAFPGALDGEPLFDIPKNMNKVFKADALAAELAIAVTVKSRKKDKDGNNIEVKRIDTRDSAGRVIDVHALRHTFGTLLAKSGVSLQVAQRAMRHSDPKLTANVYTHLGLLDVAGAVNALPSLGASCMPVQLAAQSGNSVAPTVALRIGFSSHKQANLGTRHDSVDVKGDKGDTSVSCPIDRGIRNMAQDGGREKWRAQQDSNLWPLAPEASALSS